MATDELAIVPASLALQLNTAPCDKSEWGDGPWQNEPDFLQWRMSEPPHYECQINRNPMFGTLCGYVAIPPGHPAHGLDFEHEGISSLEVHGRITFGEQGTEGRWVLGFDCGHGFDLQPYMAKQYGAMRLLRDDFIAYRDIAFVRAETESLARQLGRLEQGAKGLLR